MDTSTDIPIRRLPNEPPTARSLRYLNRKGHFPFLDLPNEVRNNISECAIPEARYAIVWVENLLLSRY